MQHLSEGDAKTYAKNWYFNHYWEPEGCNDLAYPLDCYVFVESVNTEGADCHRTRDMAKSASSPENFLRVMDVHYKEIAELHPEKAKFLRGWENRLAQIKTAFTEVS
jgi:hypothetical protein